MDAANPSRAVTGRRPAITQQAPRNSTCGGAASARRALLVLLCALCVACGRIGFEPTRDRGGGLPDAAPWAATPDAGACPGDPDKAAPGVCGCGVSDVDTDGDGTPDCLDDCALNADKTAPGRCGCDALDTDRDGDGTLDCDEECPDDPGKLRAGACGCGRPEDDTDGDGTPDCADECPTDPDKAAAGRCGCGVSDVDTDSGGTPDCLDECPLDADKTEIGRCGCGVPESECRVFLRGLDLSGDENTRLRFDRTVSDPTEHLLFTLTGGEGNPELFVSRGYAPTTSSFDCRSVKPPGETEACALSGPGTYHVLVIGRTPFRGWFLRGSQR